jgi:endonuclease/exonuclease/phosphatase family metal-dependent hydrolase
MKNLFSRQHTVLGQEVREPTLLALALTAFGFLLLLAAGAVAVSVVATLGYGWFAFAAVALVLVALLLGSRLRKRPNGEPPTGRRRWRGRLVGAGKIVFGALLAAWLGLIAWAELSPGGPMPTAKAEPEVVRVLTWNIFRGGDTGLPWQHGGWPTRKHALAAALREIQPDIFCVQEARPEQVAFLEMTLPHHQRVGVGRDDGQDGGEHCAIYFRRDRFEYLDCGTFWLEEPSDQPPRNPSGQRGGGGGLSPSIKRICTWVRLRDRVTGRTVRVYNTHQYLTESSRLPGSRIIRDHIKAGDPHDAVVLVGDFNTGPHAASRRVFGEIGLRETAALAGKQPAPSTYQLYGVRLGSLDGILVGRGWGVGKHAVVDVKPGGIYPSDHFGVLADLTLSR